MQGVKDTQVFKKQAIRIRTTLAAAIHGPYGYQKGKGLIWCLQVQSQSQIRNPEEIRLSSSQTDTENGKEGKLEHGVEKR